MKRNRRSMGSSRPEIERKSTKRGLKPGLEAAESRLLLTATTLFSLTTPSPVVSEANGSTYATLTREWATSESQTVDFAVGFQGPGATTDAAIQHLTFAPGEVAKTIPLPITNDNRPSGPFYYFVSIKDIPSGTEVAPGRVEVTVKVIDDDPPYVGAPKATLATTRGKVSGVSLAFDGPLNASSAKSRGTYQLSTAGRDGIFGTKDDRTVAIRSIAYNASTRTVTLRPAQAFGRNTPVRLTVRGTGPSALLDSVGRAIDGDGDHEAGGDVTIALASVTARHAPKR